MGLFPDGIRRRRAFDEADEIRLGRRERRPVGAGERRHGDPHVADRDGGTQNDLRAFGFVAGEADDQRFAGRAVEREVAVDFGERGDPGEAPCVGGEPGGESGVGLGPFAAQTFGAFFLEFGQFPGFFQWRSAIELGRGFELPEIGDLPREPVVIELEHEIVGIGGRQDPRLSAVGGQRPAGGGGVAGRRSAEVAVDRQIDVVVGGEPDGGEQSRGEKQRGKGFHLHKNLFF